jgi:hypothetical protein
MLAIATLAWALVPFVVIAVYASRHGGAPTGAFSSLVIEDQFQYFAWIRESGDHVGISNLFDTGQAHHAFVLPPFLLSGLLWRIGLPLQLAYHLWTVVGVLGLCLAVAAYARRSFPTGGWLGAAALAIVFGAPLMIISPWTDITGSHGGDRLMQYVVSPLAATWGYVPRLLSIAAMPAFLLAVEAVLVPARRRWGWSRTRWVVAASALGMAAAWIHPWQGLVLVLIVLGLVALDRLHRRNLILAVPLAATVAPLVYYAALHHYLPEWAQASQNANYYNLGDFLVVLGPFAVLAALGVRNPGEDVHERALLLWPVVTAIAFLAPTGGRFELVAGLDIPLAILCVRGWRRFRIPRPVTALAALLVLAGLAVPLVHDAHEFISDGQGTVWLADGDRAALDAMESSPAPGSVLADSHVAATTVAFTGRPMWAAHANWSPDYVQRATAMNQAVAGRLPPSTMRTLIGITQARFLFRDCRLRPLQTLKRRLGPLAQQDAGFGCAQVIALR